MRKLTQKQVEEIVNRRKRCLISVRLFMVVTLIIISVDIILDMVYGFDFEFAMNCIVAQFIITAVAILQRRRIAEFNYRITEGYYTVSYYKCISKCKKKRRHTVAHISINKMNAKRRRMWFVTLQDENGFEFDKEVSHTLYTYLEEGNRYTLVKTDWDEEFVLSSD